MNLLASGFYKSHVIEVITCTFPLLIFSCFVETYGLEMNYQDVRSHTNVVKVKQFIIWVCWSAPSLLYFAIIFKMGVKVIGLYYFEILIIMGMWVSKHEIIESQLHVTNSYELWDHCPDKTGITQITPPFSQGSFELIKKVAWYKDLW